MSVFSQEGTGAEGQKSVCVVFSDLLPGVPAVCGGADAVGLAETREAATCSFSKADLEHQPGFHSYSRVAPVSGHPLRSISTIEELASRNTTLCDTSLT